MKAPRSTRASLAAIAGLLAALTSTPGCSISPQPDPPIVPNPVLDPGRVRMTADPVAHTLGPVFAGAPGSVQPAEGSVTVTNLDDTSAPARAPVQPDGSFNVVATGDWEQEYRLQVQVGTRRSNPVDLPQKPRAFEACFTLEPAQMLGFGDAQPGPVERTLTMRNGCSSALRFAAPRLRAAGSAFSLPQAAAFALEPGQATTLRVVGAVSAGLLLEEILFVEIVEPQRDRRPITLWFYGEP